MVEGGALEVPEEEIAEGLQVAHAGIKELIGIQKEMLAQVDAARRRWRGRPRRSRPGDRARAWRSWPATACARR